MFRAVSFHTDDAIYTPAAAQLRASANKVGLPIHIETAPNRGCWEKNCAYKAEYVRNQWRQSSEPIVWLDADATINAFPSLFSGLDADFALYRGGGHFASGTLYFGRSREAGALLDRWVDHCRHDPMQWDQASLERAWDEINRELPLKTTWLPWSYCAKFDEAGADKAVIVHWQASRRARPRIRTRLLRMALGWLAIGQKAP